MEVSVYEAKSKLSEMIKRALSGEDVVITRSGETTVRLVPVAKQIRWVGSAKGKGQVLETFFRPLYEKAIGDDTDRPK